MSGLLAVKVWFSNLHRRLKPLAATLADLANDDGSSIYPSVEYIAWRLSSSKRVVRSALADLRKAGVLRAERNATGGRGLTTEYRLIEANLPKRASWRGSQNPAESAPFTMQNPAKRDGKPCKKRRERVQNSAQMAIASFKETSVDPSGETLGGRDWIPIDAWVAFMQMRKKKGWATTEHCVDLLIQKLTRLKDAGEDPREVLEEAVMRGYRGLFGVRGRSNGNDRGSKNNGVRATQGKYAEHAAA